MTYNLLANSLVNANRHLYRRCEPNVLPWENRSLILLKELEETESHTLDFYCFQELDQFDYDNLFKERFAQWGYSGVYKKRNGDKHDGCAIFFRNQSVKAVSIVTVDYNQNPFIDRDNVGIIGLFDIRQGARTQRICIATTHVLFNPKRGMLKIAQLRMLLEQAKALIDSEDKDLPIILCGDMNALPHSTVVNYLLKESVDVSALPENYMSGQFKGQLPTGLWANGISEFHEAFNNTNSQIDITTKTIKGVEAIVEESQESIHESTNVVEISRSAVIPRGDTARGQGPMISQPFLLRSAYDISAPSHDARGNNRVPRGQPFTTYHLFCREICDYIFYGNLRQRTSDSQSANRLELVACLELPCRLLDDEPSLPTAKFGSDHLSLVSKFRFV